MTEVVFENPEKGEARSASDAKIKTALTKLKETVNGKIGQANFEANAALAGKWYAPKVIATEETRSATTMGLMPTPDEITSVVVPSTGILRVGYIAAVKSSVEGQGVMFLCVGTNPAVGGAGSQVTTISGSTATFHIYATDQSAAGGVFSQIGAGGASVPTTGVVVRMVDLYVAAGTYNVSVQFAALSGSVTAKERRLYVEIHGT